VVCKPCTWTASVLTHFSRVPWLLFSRAPSLVSLSLSFPSHVEEACLGRCWAEAQLNHTPKRAKEGSLRGLSAVVLVVPRVSRSASILNAMPWLLGFCPCFSRGRCRCVYMWCTVVPRPAGLRRAGGGAGGFRKNDITMDSEVCRYIWLQIFVGSFQTSTQSDAELDVEVSGGPCGEERNLVCSSLHSAAEILGSSVVSLGFVFVTRSIITARMQSVSHMLC